MLESVSDTALREKWFPNRVLPLADERARLIRETGLALKKNFNGSAAEFIRSAAGSASSLVSIITATLPGFRDHAIYQGHQIFLYKRAQILVADWWGAFAGENLGKFVDINSLTMFPDYSQFSFFFDFVTVSGVPQFLFSKGVLQYDDELKSKVLSKVKLLD